MRAQRDVHGVRLHLVGRPRHVRNRLKVRGVDAGLAFVLWSRDHEAGRYAYGSPQWMKIRNQILTIWQAYNYRAVKNWSGEIQVWSSTGGKAVVFGTEDAAEESRFGARPAG